MVRREVLRRTRIVVVRRNCCRSHRRQTNRPLAGRTKGMVILLRGVVSVIAYCVLFGLFRKSGSGQGSVLNLNSRS